MPEGFCTNCGAPRGDARRGRRGCSLCDSKAGPSSLPPRPWLGIGPAGQVGIRYADGVIVVEGDRVLVEGEPPPDHLVQVPHRSTDVRMRIGAYDVLDELGRGAMGVVYRAYSLRLRRTCALKVLSGGEHSTGIEIQRFQNEAMLAARLDHPNIVRIFDAGEDRGLHFFVMEYIDARPFSTWMGRRDDAALTEGLAVIAKVARALDHAHRQGIIHRDVKPDNILVDAEDVPHVTDFGIAKTLDQETGMTFAGRPVGTPWYMPPEQANGELQNIGPLSDVYSLGATMYHLLAGRPPFGGDHPMVVMMDVIRKEPDRPAETARRLLGRVVPKDIEAICLKAMEKDATRRYPSAAAFADDIEAFLAGRAVSVRAPTWVERLGKRLERNRPVLAAATILVLSLLLLTVAFGAVVLFNMDRTNESLRKFGRRASIEQAETVDRAVRAAMLDEKPQVARMLVERVRRAPGLSVLEVLRPDGSPAWDGPAPSMPQRADVSGPHPPSHPPLQRLAITPETWHSMLDSRQPLVRDEVVDGERFLTVLRPLVNETVCRACHEETAEDGILAVLVLRQSLSDVDRQIHDNQNLTAIVGGSTAIVVVLMLFVMTRLFGIGLRPRVFGRHDPLPGMAPAGHDTTVDPGKPA